MNSHRTHYHEALRLSRKARNLRKLQLAIREKDAALATRLDTEAREAETKALTLLGYK